MKDGSYLSCQTQGGGGEVGPQAAISACPPGSLPCGENLALVVWNVLIFLGCRGLQGQAEVGERQMERVEGVVLWDSKFKC